MMGIFGGGSTVFDPGGGFDEAAFLAAAHTWTDRQTFSGDIKTGIGVKLILDDDEDTWIDTDIDDRARLIARGGIHVTFEGTVATSFQRVVQMANRLTMFTIGADPGAVANAIHFYAKDVAASSESFTQDEAANVTQLSPHKLREWVYNSKNIKTNRELLIQMEKFMLEKYPEYVKVNDIQQSKIPGNTPNGHLPVFTVVKPKWYQIITRYRMWKNGRR